MTSQQIVIEFIIDSHLQVQEIEFLGNLVAYFAENRITAYSAI